MNRKQRVLYVQNGVIHDASSALNGFRSGTYVLPVVAAQDALYICSELPFNHKYFDVSVANAVASVVSVQTWTGSEWKDAVDITDETAVAGASLGQSGLLTFGMDLDRISWSWHRDSNTIPELVGTRIFNQYWARFKWTVNLTSSTALKYVGQRFSDDGDLFDYYPDLNNSELMLAFEAGKTDWKAQSFAAAETIVADLRSQSVVIRRDQILDVHLFQMASLHKVASIVYAGLGHAYRDREVQANERYVKALSMKYFEVDNDGDAVGSPMEKTMSTGFMTR